MFSLLICDEITIKKNSDGTYKVTSKMPVTLEDGSKQNGYISIEKANVYLKVDALADDNKTIMNVYL